MSRALLAMGTLLLLAVAALWGVPLHGPNGVEASGHSATRTFESSTVAPEAELVVTIAASDYGAFAKVVETLPEGFRFVESSLPESGVDLGAGTATFTLLGEGQFTYTVEAPLMEGTYDFSGLLIDQGKEDRQVGGDTSLRVEAAPTPTPTAMPTPTPEPTATPEPEPTAMPDPTETPIPPPTSMPTPAPTPTSASAPEPTEAPETQPTATPTAEPAPTSTQEPVSTPSPEPTQAAGPPDEEDGLPVLPIAVVIGLAAVVGLFLYLRSQF